MNKHTAYLLLALAISALKNLRVPEHYNVLFGIGYCAQRVNDLIYFLGIDLVVVFLMLTICSLSKHDKVFNIISKSALYLAWAKTVDEVSAAPYGYHFAEFIFDALIFLGAIRSYILYRLNSTKNN